jgi:signal transduction histidine kinase
MDTLEKSGSAAPRSLPEAVTRTLRHEVGDLLQTIYATVAILQRRLPNEYALERRVLADLRARAETCKQLLDTVHDFVCPITLSAETIDLADLADRLKESAASRHPELVIQTEASSRPQIQGDPRRLAQAGELLLDNACEAAARHVWFHTGHDSSSGMIEWTITDDGPGVTPDQLEQLFVPFLTTRQGRPGVGLALAHKIVTLSDGQISAENMEGGGLRVRVLLPAAHGNEGRQEYS